MRHDLHRYFGYQVKIDFKPMSCWVLSSIDSTKAIEKSIKVRRETNLNESTGLPIFFNNSRLSNLVSHLERKILKVPVIDETNIQSNVTLQLPKDLHDISLLQSSLEKQGLKLTRELRTIPIAIITKPSN